MVLRSLHHTPQPPVAPDPQPLDCQAKTLVARGDVVAWPTLDGFQFGSSEPSYLCKVNVVSLAVGKLVGC